ncbi:hypothetical protein WH47_02443, partial [Habropoda laboriosa]
LSAPYSKRLEAVFLCCHFKGSKTIFTATAKYLRKSRQFVTPHLRKIEQSFRCSCQILC